MTNQKDLLPDGLYLYNDCTKLDHLSNLKVILNKIKDMQNSLIGNKENYTLPEWSEIKSFDELAKYKFGREFPVIHGCISLFPHDENGNYMIQLPKKLYHVQLFMDGCGIAYIHEWKYSYVLEREKAISKDQCMTIKFYKFGCNHVFKEYSSKECFNDNNIRIYNCEHYYKCDKCNYSYIVDSSD